MAWGSGRWEQSELWCAIFFCNVIWRRALAPDFAFDFLFVLACAAASNREAESSGGGAAVRKVSFGLGFLYAMCVGANLLRSVLRCALFSGQLVAAVFS